MILQKYIQYIIWSPQHMEYLDHTDKLQNINLKNPLALSTAPEFI